MKSVSNSKNQGDITYVPSSVSVVYKDTYSIEINKSGRLQYYKQPDNKKRIRITKTEFTRRYNSSKILAIEPVQSIGKSGNHILFKFFTM